ncbi:protein disulfide-isomerase TMX3-like isoform X1 [Pogoniulus pusillus]|uniref:protein disulfide-isomerase TMX3-like isoform X1 n=1 Tax=Pogoniulus pusillus TaxID=488313 RepID=UPI0030B972F2
MAVPQAAGGFSPAPAHAGGADAEGHPPRDAGGQRGWVSELTIRTTVVLNASNQQCLLPDRHLEKTEDMVKFMKDILDGAAEAQAGDGLLQRSKRVICEAKAAVMVEFIAYSVR